MNEIRKIGILTGGGDCPGLNAVIRAVVLAASRRGWEVLGFMDGYEGLLDPVRYQVLDPRSTDGIAHLGGTILGTTNRGRFASKIADGKRVLIQKGVIEETRKTLENLGVDALICVGGDGSLGTALQLHKAGIRLVGVPKTIDNDISATATSFGFDSAVCCVVDALDRLHTTAQSHKRIMVVEVMGRYAGWIALHGGFAGGAHAILVPEIPFRYEPLARMIQERETRGYFSTMIVVAEGARERGKKYVTKTTAGSKTSEMRLGGIAEMVSHKLAQMTHKESRHVVLGHLQRGGNPTALDRILGARFGVGAVDLLARGRFGQMVTYQNYCIGSVWIEHAVRALKLIQPQTNQMIDAARQTGIFFGDEPAVVGTHGE